MAYKCKKCGCVLIRHKVTNYLKCTSCGHINNVKDLHGEIDKLISSSLEGK